jgi:hypothetical protein
MTISATAERSRPAVRAAVTCLAVGVVAVANTLLFFRHSLLTGFAQVSADIWDGRTILAIYEHWYRVLTLQEHWRSPLYYFPVPDALGYTDAFFLHGVIYSVARALGFGMLVSDELVSIAFKLIGFAGFYRLAHRLLRVRVAWALLGASVFYQLNATAVHLGHPQLLVLNLFPGMIELAVCFAVSLAAGRRPAAFAAGCAALAVGAACTMSGLYMSWFLALFGCATALAYLLLAPAPALARLGSAAVRLAVRGGWVVPALLAVAAALLVPAITIYWPTATETGMHNLAVLREFAGTPVDLVNLGTANRLWSDVVDGVAFALTGQHLQEGERTSGITPGLLVLGICAAAWLWRHASPAQTIVRAALLAGALLWLASFRIGDFLGWDVLFSYVPFGRALRVPPRIQIFFEMFLVLAVAVWLDRMRWPDQPVRFVALAAFLILEEFNGGYGWGMQPAIENRVLVALPPPPPACRSFFVVRAMPRSDMSQGNRDYYWANAEGMVVAERFGIPTLNGIATFHPAGWDLNRPDAPDYRDRVLGWARARGILDGLCSLDAEAGRWEMVAR